MVEQKSCFAIAPKMLNKSLALHAPIKEQSCFAPKMFEQKCCFAPKMFEQKCCFAPKMFEQKCSFAPKMFEQKYYFGPNMFEQKYYFAPKKKSLVLHQKCLNKVLLCTPNF